MRSRASTVSSSPASAPPIPRCDDCAATASSSRSSRGSPPIARTSGICLGLQLLFERSDEDGARTFGVLPGHAERLVDAPRLPHIGWNQVERRRDDPLFDGIADGANFYFVHSYAGRPTAETDAELVVAETTHGRPFVSAIRRGNAFGVQFHPERSGRDGLRLLANFVQSVEARPAVRAGDHEVAA